MDIFMISFAAAVFTLFTLATFVSIKKTIELIRTANGSPTVHMPNLARAD